MKIGSAGLACAVSVWLVQPAAADCRYTASREATIDVSAAGIVRVEARQGSLCIEGRAGATDIRATGEACASSASLLEQVQIVADRVGDEVRVRAIVPKVGWWGESAKLDLVVEVPETLPLVVEDSSGDIEITKVASAEVDDSSGDLSIRDVAAGVRVHDSSGAIDIRNVQGLVQVDDSSGDIDISHAGSVQIDRDSSGPIDVEDVRGDVLVKHDSSGSIEVRRVGGDFTVERDGSGGIDYADVVGQVRLPDSN